MAHCELHCHFQKTNSCTHSLLHTFSTSWNYLFRRRLKFPGASLGIKCIGAILFTISGLVLYENFKICHTFGIRKTQIFFFSFWDTLDLCTIYLLFVQNSDVIAGTGIWKSSKEIPDIFTRPLDYYLSNKYRITYYL